jgi:hypothetical protein
VESNLIRAPSCLGVFGNREWYNARVEFNVDESNDILLTTAIINNINLLPSFRDIFKS